MQKLKKLLLYFMLPATLICMAEGILYYSRFELSTAEILISSLENTTRIFLIKPIINVFNAISASHEYPTIGKIITWLYSIVVNLAPFFSLITVVLSFKALFLSIGNSVSFSSKKKMAIIGDGELADDIAYKYAKQYQVHYMMPTDTSDEHKLKLVKEHIVVTTVDYNCITSTCEDNYNKNTSVVFLYFRDWYKNLENTLAILDFIVKLGKTPTVKVCFIDVPPVLKRIFQGYESTVCKKSGKPKTCLEMSFYTINGINAKLFLRNASIPKHKDGKYHIIFNGFGNFGRAYFKELFDYFLSSGINATFEVFDHDITQKMGDLIFGQNKANPDCSVFISETEKNAEVSLDAKSEKAVLHLNFYKAAVDDVKYFSYVSAITHKDQPTDVFVCIDNTSVCYNFYRLFYLNNNIFKYRNLYFRVSPRTSVFFDTLKDDTTKIITMPDGLPDIDFLGDNDFRE